MWCQLPCSRSLNDKGLTAAYVDTETRNDKEKLERVRSCHFSLLFISPELQLLNLAVREMLYPGEKNGVIARNCA